MVDTGVVEVVTRGVPGMKDILILGKVKQLERAGAADVLLVDAPASGHAITFLRSARGLLDAVRVGPIRTQARDVLELLTDGDRCQVLLATLAEETPVNELIETAYSLEEDVGVKLGPVIVNGRYPTLPLPTADGDGARSWPSSRRPRRRACARRPPSGGGAVGLQASQVERLAAALPLPQLAHVVPVHARRWTWPTWPPWPPSWRRASRALPVTSSTGAPAPARRAALRLDGLVDGVDGASWSAPDRAGSARRPRRRRWPPRAPAGAGAPWSSPSTRPAAGRRPGSGQPDQRAPAGDRARGRAGGGLHALQLDTKTTFDELVGRYAADDAQRRRILGNRFYRNISNALSGTQEYMAAEKLYALHEGDGFDLIVVDTPPSRNALDVLDAPNQLARLLDHRVYRVLTRPSRGVGRAVNRAAQTVLRHAGRVVGAEVIDDVGRLLHRLRGHGAGLPPAVPAGAGAAGFGGDRLRARGLAPGRHVGEALHFASRLDAQGLAVRGLVVNRVHPPSAAAPPASARARADGGRRCRRRRSGALWSNLADFRAVAEREEDSLALLASRVAPAPVVRVPLLDDDVHDLGRPADRGLAPVVRAARAA